MKRDLNFSIAFDEFPEISPLVNRLRRSVGRGDLLEATLRGIEGEAQGYPYRHRQLLALRYYLRRIITECGTTWMRQAHGVTHYAELVDEIERWRVQTRADVCYVTFNYDTMLEDVLGPRYGAGFVDIHSYLRSDFTLIKLHGSVDWAHRIPVPPDIVDDFGALRNYLFEYAGQYPLFSIVKAGSGQVVYEKDGLVPALAIPVQGKTTFECPKEHLSRLNEAVGQTTRVVSIGWRGVEQHFLDLWKNRNDFFDLIVASGSSSWSGETLENLRVGQMVKNDTRHRRVAFEGGFGELLGSGELRFFLESPSSAQA